MNRVPLYLLSGFLGSGKTTLVAQMLKAPAFANTAIVVNELGEIGLDHLLIERSSDRVVLLESGCLCCTISDSLQETLADLNFRKARGEVPAFERVVIETTGLADPGPILNILLGYRLVTDHYRLETVIVAVSVQHGLAQLQEYAEAARQIAVADRIVLTKLDLADAPAELLGRISQLNPGASLLESRRGSAALQAFAPRESSGIRAWANVDASLKPVMGAEPPHGEGRHDTHIRAYCLFPADAASWAGLAAWCRVMSESFGKRLLRCKGLLKIAETGQIVFVQGVQGVFHTPDRLPGWPDDDHRSRVVCIVRDVDEADLRAVLRALALPVGSDPGVTLAELEPEDR